MDNQQYLDRFKEYDSALKQAVNYRNDSLTVEALRQEKRRRVHEAQRELKRDLPNPATHSDLARVKANQALQNLAPKTADQVAVTVNEWAKVESMLSNGSSLETLISKADRNRLSAIYDRFPTSATATGLTELEAVKDEIDLRTLNRLAELSDADAVSSVESRNESESRAIWQKAIDETCEGELSLLTRTQLHKIVGPAFEENQGSAMSEATMSRQLKLINLNSFTGGE